MWKCAACCGRWPRIWLVASLLLGLIWLAGVFTREALRFNFSGTPTYPYAGLELDYGAGTVFWGRDSTVAGPHRRWAEPQARIAPAPTHWLPEWEHSEISIGDAQWVTYLRIPIWIPLAGVIGLAGRTIILARRERTPPVSES